MHEYGVNAWQEKFGPVGPGWSYSHFEAQMLTPQYAPLIGFPLAWTPGTHGTVTADAIYAVLATDDDLQRLHGQLKGKIALVSTIRDLTPKQSR